MATNKKKVILVHGWDGTPQTGWFPWLKTELEKRGFEVVVPQLPETNAPRIKNWVPALAAAAGEVDENTFLVGHSMGCQTIARYLEGLPESAKVGGVIFVAGFFLPLLRMESEEDKDIDREWVETPLDLAVVRAHMGKSIALFSDNDPWVPLENAKVFDEKLGSEVIIKHNESHFEESAGYTTLPIVLEKLLEIAG